MADIFIKSNFNNSFNYKRKYIIEKGFGNSINIFPFINDISKTNSLILFQLLKVNERDICIFFIFKLLFYLEENKFNNNSKN